MVIKNIDTHFQWYLSIKMFLLLIKTQLQKYNDYIRPSWFTNVVSMTPATVLQENLQPP